MTPMSVEEKEEGWEMTINRLCGMSFANSAPRALLNSENICLYFMRTE